LLDRESEPDLLSTVGRLLDADRNFHVIAEAFVALDHFPNHKIGITLRGARIRMVKG